MKHLGMSRVGMEQEILRLRADKMRLEKRIHEMREQYRRFATLARAVVDRHRGNRTCFEAGAGYGRLPAPSALAGFDMAGRAFEI
jgi:hypothetical protein